MPAVEGVVTPEYLWITLVTIIALGAVLLLVLNIISKWKELKKPKMNEEELIKSVKKHDVELQLLLKAQMLMLKHMVDGNSVDKLKEMQDEINRYLLTLL
ncbi:MAG: hypothetical protein J6S83_09400 [Lachnospiraceae bacterium]|nr:hypothetical protein [Lachnospiraceae bacterium]